MHSNWNSARIADFQGHRLYVKRAEKGARHFSVYLDGKYQGMGDNIEQACGMAARAARNLNATKT